MAFSSNVLETKTMLLNSLRTLYKIAARSSSVITICLNISSARVPAAYDGTRKTRFRFSDDDATCYTYAHTHARVSTYRTTTIRADRSPPTRGAALRFSGRRTVRSLLSARPRSRPDHAWSAALWKPSVSTSSSRVVRRPGSSIPWPGRSARARTRPSRARRFSRRPETFILRLVSSPLVVGGGEGEGTVRVRVEKRNRRTLLRGNSVRGWQIAGVGRAENTRRTNMTFARKTIKIIVFSYFDSFKLHYAYRS